ncbi:MAG: type II toxin-antitoxin system Phd/YefM family antitoxin [Hyphomicrobiales bacterium]
MRQVQASDAKTRPSRALDEVERGETVAITRRGRVIAPISCPPWHKTVRPSPRPLPASACYEAGRSR